MPQRTERILKADSLRGLGSKIVFDFEDVQQRCDDHVAEARRRADDHLATAAQEAERIRTTAREEGRRAGLAEGLARADVEIENRATQRAQALVADEVRTLVPAMRSLTAAVESERDRWLADWENRAIDVALAIAERIVHREIEVRPDFVRDTLSAVLPLVAGTGQLEIRLNPLDVERLGESVDTVVEALTGCGPTTVRADPAVDLGGCLLETRYGTVDARIATQLERIADELHSGSPS